MTQQEIIFAVDPGTCITGYGVISIISNGYQALDYGCIRPPKDFKLSDRYLIIYEALEELIAKYSATALVVESQFVSKNPQSALKLGMAKGMAILAGKRLQIPVFAYSPSQAKSAVVGNGRASKYQVQRMVQQLLRLSVMPEPEDAADALALALCHAHTAHHLKKEF